MYSGGEKSVQTATNICGKSVASFILYKKTLKVNYIFDIFKMSLFHISSIRINKCDVNVFDAEQSPTLSIENALVLPITPITALLLSELFFPTAV